MSAIAWVRRKTFGFPLKETDCARRGFRVDDAGVRSRIETIGKSFHAGYHAALETPGAASLERRLSQVELDNRGFAYEGAAMALELLDSLSLWRRHRVQEFLAGPGAAHAYMVHVGVGWARAKLPLGQRSSLDSTLARFDPLLRWLVVDGYGFYAGFFNWPRAVDARLAPRAVTVGNAYVARAFDQGLGRSLWFVEGADPDRIAARIATFEPARHGDLWSGVGLACAYAGGVDDEAICAVRDAATAHRAELAQGAAFAIKARQRAANMVAHTERVCRILCGCATDAAVKIIDDAHAALPAAESGSVPHYEIWRRAVGTELAASLQAQSCEGVSP